MPGNRKSIRLAGYDYSSVGAYYVTICKSAHENVCTGDACVALSSSAIDDFGYITNGQMNLYAAGNIIAECWHALPEHFPSLQLDAFVVMPNHVHFIVYILGSGYHGVFDFKRATHASPVQTRCGPNSGSIGAIVGSFKSTATKRINLIRGTPGAKVWHRNYYDRIIRNEDELNRIREYIRDNPINWEKDQYHPGS